MAAGNARRERYREYTSFLRVSAAELNMEVAPARLARLRSQVNLERNKFMFWMVVWLLIAVVSLVPILMLMATELSLTLPTFLADRLEAFHFQVATLENSGAVTLAVFSGLIFVGAIVTAYIPIIANSSSLNDLEYAHRALKDIEKE